MLFGNTLGLVGLSAALFVTACAQPVAAQESETRYAQVGDWTIRPSVDSEIAGGAPACAATLPGNGYDAMRIERTADGYWFGMNGFDRGSFGDTYPLAFRVTVDGFEDQAQASSGEARFAKDPAQPLDDWLLLFADPDNPDDAFFGIYNNAEMTFMIENPGNRTGNDTVATSFRVEHGEELLLGLDRCLAIATQATQSGGSVEAAFGCRNDGPHLPVSGLCKDSAINYLEVVDGWEPDLPEGCDWDVNETKIADRILLYRAARCDGRTSRLTAGVGAHMVELMIDASALNADLPRDDYGNGPKFAEVYSRFNDDPAQDVEHRALYGMRNTGSCAARPSDDLADGYIVDVSPAERARQPGDEPPAHLCGDRGYGDDADVWRVFQGHAWFLMLGQDAYQDIDYRSLTLIEPDGSGGWQLVE